MKNDDNTVGIVTPSDREQKDKDYIHGMAEYLTETISEEIKNLNYSSNEFKITIPIDQWYHKCKGDDKIWELVKNDVIGTFKENGWRKVWATHRKFSFLKSQYGIGSTLHFMTWHFIVSEPKLDNSYLLFCFLLVLNLFVWGFLLSVLMIFLGGVW